MHFEFCNHHCHCTLYGKAAAKRKSGDLPISSILSLKPIAFGRKATKIMFKSIKLAAIYVAVLFLLASCEETKQTPTPILPKGKYATGIFIISEGGFQKSNGSISFFNRKNLDSVAFEGDIFAKANSRNLGDIVQDMAIVNDKAFIVVNNSNKVEIVDAGTFKSLAPEIKLQLPRHAVAVGNKLYVTEWVSFSAPNGQVSVIDIATYKVLKTIQVGILPDNMLVVGPKILVANSNANTISVINTEFDTVENTIKVGDRPNSLVQDASGNIWVLCGGTPSWAGTATNAKLVRFNPNSATQQTTFEFVSGGADGLVINSEKNTMLYSYRMRIFSIATNATTLPSMDKPFINRRFYGLGIDKDGTIYGADALNYSVNGRVIRYNKSGIVLDSMTVGVAPSGFLFR